MRDRSRAGPIFERETKILNVGTGADGNVIISTDTNLTSTLNGSPVIMNYNNLTINANKILSVSNPCKGLFIYVKQDLIVNGTISMNGKGSTGTPTQPLVILGGMVPKNAYISNVANVPVYQVPIVGAIGGYSPGSQSNGLPGAVGTYGQTGGGASGGSYTSPSDAASPGTGYMGGNGSLGTGASPGAAGTPGGGILVIIVGGNITIGAGGIISSNGVSGGTGSNGGGGGSGGGSIIVLYSGILSNTGSVVATGGAGGSGTYTGGKGGDGSVYLVAA